MTNSSQTCFIASHKPGDPPRTLLIENAQRFESKEKANDRIIEVKKTCPFKSMFYEVRKVSNFY